jgi:hypothetical protein
MRVSGLLLCITATTHGKWWLTFDVAAQSQMATQTSFDPASQSPAHMKQTSAV